MIYLHLGRFGFGKGKVVLEPKNLNLKEKTTDFYHFQKLAAKRTVTKFSNALILLVSLHVIDVIEVLKMHADYEINFPGWLD